MSRAKKKPLSVSIVVVIIATIGSILVAVINIAGNLFMKQTEIRFTQTAAANTVSATNPIQTLTSVISPDLPTQTLSPTLSQLPESKVLFEDSFVDNRNDWYVASAYPNIVGGKYTHKIICPADYGSYYCGTYLEIPFAFPKNFRGEIDATILESSSSADVGIGFQFRRNNQDHYYIIYYITQGFYQLSITHNGNEFKLIPNVSK